MEHLSLRRRLPAAAVMVAVLLGVPLLVGAGSTRGLLVPWGLAGMPAGSTPPLG